MHRLFIAQDTWPVELKFRWSPVCKSYAHRTASSWRVGLFLTRAEVPYGLTETLDGACLRMLFYTNCLDLSNLCFLDWTVGSEDARTLSVLPARLEAPREQGSGLLYSPVSSWCSAPTATYGCWQRVYGIHQWIVPRTLNFRVIFYLYLELFFLLLPKWSKPFCLLLVFKI